jgi:hypothetical protein
MISCPWALFQRDGWRRHQRDFARAPRTAESFQMTADGGVGNEDLIATVLSIW